MRKRGFTLVEMMVAVSITVAMLAMTGVVFKSCSDASSKALAYTDMMRRVRAITGQLKRDFSGLRRDMPLAILWETHRVDLDGDGIGDETIRWDRIVFFANGDFQTMTTNPPVSGNVARIYYGHSANVDDDVSSNIFDSTLITRIHKDWMLARKQRVSTQNPDPTFANPMEYHPKPLGYHLDYPLNPADHGYGDNKADRIEYDSYDYEFISPAKWKAIVAAGPAGPIIDFIPANFTHPTKWLRRPTIDIANGTGIHMLLTQNIGEFRIELWEKGYWVGGLWIKGHWIGQEDPAGAGFWGKNDGVNLNYFISTSPWHISMPQAIRFMFTLYDKNRRHFPNGKTFTYIVKLD